MHGAVLLDENNNVLRPAILWNDGRSQQECVELESECPQTGQITSNQLMPGFQAPKIKWIEKHEPDTFKRIHRVLLPKDYLRWKITGVFATDMSDASGTSFLDVSKRDWSDVMLAACKLNRSHMPKLLEGNETSGMVLESVANDWNMLSGGVPVVAGAGDNAAGAIGLGIYKPGQAMLSLGTSGVYFVVDKSVKPDHVANEIIMYCHCLPHMWHQMFVMLSAAECLDWVAQLTGATSVESLLAEVESGTRASTPVWFLPFLSGERKAGDSRHNYGSLIGLTNEHKRVDIARAVLEGVAFAFARGIDTLHASCTSKPESIALIGGGARSAMWRQMLANVTGQTLEYYEGGDVGPALGAARLAHVAMNPTKSLDQVIPPTTSLNLIQRHIPDPQLHQQYLHLQKHFDQLYNILLPLSSLNQSIK
ncbi:hypothetical protein SAMD00019534_119430 [Acytostelium subglobosum LB1]|uniref:hypothetical protein n=1 Tax=Acytostelium subglobosum LB1 TaxID=1410327 RepID=UPI000644C646|nr:hypothetical protein SAMD00019534_119430 [Acytostelium subglobosum LB1]GAM28767.1 hypothetical protein SAMD00019534_119430 [Acytostelium subglobosum LB1]|eukprot:XP_012748322.1 hypothetical protein SAMD00019534_119430 [Acytostelium subglobosum LB1]